MPKKSDVLKMERSQKLDAQQALSNKAKTEKRDFTPEEETQFDATQSEIDALDVQIERSLKMEKNEIEIAKRNGKPVGDKGDGDEPAGDGGEGREKRALMKKYSVLRHLGLARDGKALDGAEKEMDDLGREENRIAGVAEIEGTTVRIPMSVVRAASQTVTQDSGLYGAALVADGMPRVSEPFQPRLFLEELGATRLSGLSGGDIPLPVFGNYTWEWLAETASITPQKTQIGGPVLSPERLGAAVPISMRLMRQSSIDVEAMVMKILRRGYENALQYAAINGSGTSNQPRGLLNTTGIQSVTHDPRLATRADLLTLQSLLEIANTGDADLGYLTHPAMKFALKGIPVTAMGSRFLWEGNEMDGIKAVSSSLVPALSGNYPVIYGDWSNLFIGEWGALNLVIDPYTRVLSGELQVVANAYAGVAVSRPQAFAVDKFLTTVEPEV